MSAATPGPWWIAPHSEDDERLYIVARYEVLPNGQQRANWIAECDLQEDPDENAANARLIAAAPLLRDALKRLLNYTNQLELLVYAPDDTDTHDIVAQARAALAAAEPEAK